MRSRAQTLTQISLVTVVAALTSAVAFAATAPTSPASQSADPIEEDSGQGVDDIVVTGTLVRGIAPAGTSVSTIGRADIDRTGATSVNQLLSTIPQMSNAFNLLPTTPTAAQGLTTFRPNLRNLPSGGNGATLLLIDGRNIVGAAIQQNSPDIGMLPPGAIERVEVLLDGGSSIYGSDAIGGTLNLITRSRFDGVEINGTGGGDLEHYKNASLNLTGGKSWDGGGLVVSLYGRTTSQLPAGDRDVPRQDLREFGLGDYRVRTCAPGTVTASGVTYALPDRQRGTVNLCDTAIDGVVVPQEKQFGGYLSLSQQLSSNLDFVVKAYGSRRKTETRATQLGTNSARIDGTNPFFTPIGAETFQTVAFNYSPVLGRYSYTGVKLTQYEINPTLTWQPGGGWRVSLLGNYGWSKTIQTIPGINSTAENAALRGVGLTTDTALNPYDLTLTNPDVIRSITDWGSYASNTQTLAQGRLTVDGALFDLPGGPVRVAVGTQFSRLTVSGYSLTGSSTTETGAVTARKGRTIKSLFGQLVVPIVGNGNAVPGIRSLVLDASARYDHYQEVGSTTNPRIGLSWEVAEGFKINGSFGTSFTAPGVGDVLVGGIDSQIMIQNTTAVRTGDPASDRNRPTLVLTGGNTGLKPETATNWSVGFDARPPALPGFQLSASYWNIDIKDMITSGVAGGTLQTNLDNPALTGAIFTFNPTLEQLRAASRGIQIVSGNASTIETLYGNGNDPYFIWDRRRRNTGGYKTSGLDARIGYRHDTSWGSLHGSVSGSRILTRQLQQYEGGPWINQRDTDFSKLTAQAIVGADIGRFTATATINYTQGFDITGAPGQTHIGYFAPVNLYLSYDFDEDSSMSLNVDNINNDSPDIVNVTGGLTTLQRTIGRAFSLSFRKKF